MQESPWGVDDGERSCETLVFLPPSPSPSRESAMARRACSRRELLDRLRGIQEAEEDNEESACGSGSGAAALPSSRKRLHQSKEEWFSDTFDFLIHLPKETHLWCGCWELMGPLLEAFHNFFKDKCNDSPLKLLWKRVSQELGLCTQCVCQHHQAQETYSVEYESHTVGPLLKTLQCLDEERVAEHLKEINAKIVGSEYDPEYHSSEVVSIMFEVLMFPTLLDDQSLVNEFQVFIEAIDDSHELALSGHQQYPGVYALLFLRSSKARAVGLRLAQSMGKLRCPADLEPLQPLLKKYIGILEIEVLPSSSEASRPRVQHERLAIWLGIKTLLGFLESAAFEEGILERYPIFLSMVLNHVSDDTPEFSYAVTCLRLLFEMLGCKLWLRTTLSPSMMRNTLLGQSFHTRNEKSHKEIFDLFLPFLQSLEALQDGEHEKQRRHLLYFLLHQVTHSGNFSCLMRKNARKIALLIVHRGYTMNPPCPPSECSHMWGPSLVCSLKDSSLHSSLRQPAFDLMQTIIVSDAAALISLTLQYNATSSIDMASLTDFNYDEDDITFSHDAEGNESSCWSEFSVQRKLASQESKEWMCVPMLWFDVLVEVDPSVLPISFSKAVVWALSHSSVVDPDANVANELPVRDWLTVYAGEIVSSLGWEVPSGSDDGEGRESKNSVKASSTCIPLIRAFKRCSTHFVIQMEQHGLQKQFTWEPKMAESLILSLVDPNDNVRQADRVILEHVSKTRGLTPGLQFLCSSATSLSAMYSGLKYALKQVQLNSTLLTFRNLHHLFFIVRKLLKEVVCSQMSATAPREDVNHSNFKSGGGFLRQLCFDHSPVTSRGCLLNNVDVKSWEVFSCLLSAITWPSILKFLIKGKEYIDNKSCQMTCVRLLEIIPVVFERISFSAPKIPRNFEVVVSRVFDFKWLPDLADWGKSSLVVISRHWKQSILSLLDIIKGSCHVNVACTIGAIETMMHCDAVAVDELKERLSQLSLFLYKETVRTVEETSKAEPLPSKHSSLGRKSSVTDNSFPEPEDLYFDKVSVSRREEDNVIVLSDDETEMMPSPELVISSSSKSSEHMLEKVSVHKCSSVLADNVGSAKATLSRETLRSSLASQKHGGHVLDKHQLYSEFIPPVVGGAVSSMQSKWNSTNNSLSFRKVDPVLSGSSAHSFPHEKSDLFSTVTGVEKMADVPRDVIFDAANDPLESAFNSVRHQPQMTKSSISVPKRKIIQLEMPVNNKYGLLNRMDNGVRRLKPPKLDDWYRPILEIDYFSIVGLSSDSDTNATMAKLKEVPLSFSSSDHYIEIFRPLVLEEFKAQLQKSFSEASSSDETFCGNLCILSVERVDDFHIVRARPEDSESAWACSENDLVLLTKKPLDNSEQHLHVVGKVERREKTDKRRSIILVIRFYLQNGSSRLNKVSRLLIERSKWYVSRIMSITPQLREFQALSSLNDIPMLPVILRPTDCSPSLCESGKIELGRLSAAMNMVLKSAYNDSQLQAISLAIGIQGSKRSSELALVQGPPGTGKTRTIVAIVSALLTLGSSNQHGTSKELNSDSMKDSTTCSNRTRISQSAAIARAWQDAAYAKQMIRDEEQICSGSVQKFVRGRVLICAQSNAAVDELVSRIKAGLYGDDGKMYKPYLVRVGNVKTVHPNSLPFFIDTLVEQRLAEDKSCSNARNDTHVDSSASLQSRLEKLVERIRLYESKRAKLRDQDVRQRIFSDDGSSKVDDGEETSDAAIESKLNILYGQKKTICADLAVVQSREKKLSEENKLIRHKIRRSILREAEIVVTTLSGCGGDIYGACFNYASHCKMGNFSEQFLFDAVIIDEAAQALEPATLIPLQLLKSNGTKSVMVGDPKQLPATVMSSVASKFLYECSMFERMQRAGYPVVMLTEQYRMHHEICRFPSMHFYEGKLLSSSQMAIKSAPFHESAHLGPYMFFDIVDGHESHGKRSGSQSLYNESEADAAVEIMKFFVKRYSSEFAAGRIGVITPYKSQLSLLRSRFSSAFGPSMTADMEFNTVDGFQGREVDILILSTVRASISNAREHGGKSGNIGFVADVRRMNVALTRAKLSLWIVGNARTLQTNFHWYDLVNNAKERNLFMSVSRPYGAVFNSVPCLSKKDLNSPHLETRLRQQKKADFKDARHASQSVRLNTKEGHQRETKSSKNETKQDKRGVMHDHVSNKVDGRVRGSTDVLHGGLPHKHKNEEFTMKRRIATNAKGDLKDIPREKGKSSDKLCTSKERSIDNQVGSKTNLASGQLETDSSIKTLIKKAKCVQEISERSIPRNVNSIKAVISQTSTEGKHREKEAGDKERLHSSEETHRDIMSKRKRQRDAVDALLSSALISSKKPESLTKPAPNRPLSSKNARDAIKSTGSSEVHPSTNW